MFHRVEKHLTKFKLRVLMCTPFFFFSSLSRTFLEVRKLMINLKDVFERFSQGYVPDYVLGFTVEEQWLPLSRPLLSA